MYHEKKNPSEILPFLILLENEVFLTATWLPHGQLWATVEEVASLI